MAFTPSEPLVGRIESRARSSGFTPLDDVAASRVKPALSLEQLIAEKNAGEFPAQSQPLAAFIRGLLNSSLAGTTEGIGAIAGANPQFDPNSPEFTNPASNYAGEFLGNLVPLGRIKQAATGLSSLVKEGARLGGVYGVGQGVSSEAREVDPTIGGAVEKGLTQGATGVALGAGIPLLSGAAVKLIPTKQNILDDLIKLDSSEGGKMERSVSGGYVQAADKLAPFLKKNSGVSGFIEASEKALDKEASSFKPIIENANASYLNPDLIYNSVDQELSKMIPNPETRKALLDGGDFLSDLFQLTPKNLLQYASKANREIGRIYKNPNTPITQESIALKEAVRDVYGNTIRKILEDAGQDPGVYSGYGAIKEMASQIGKNYLRESYKLSAQEARSLPQNLMAGLETGGGGLNIGRGVQSTIAPITGGEKGRLDRQANGLIDGLFGFKREKTNADKAEKLDLALQILNTINKNNAEPLQAASDISEALSGE